MAFTEDELQSLNSIVEQKLLAQSQTFIKYLDQRMQALTLDFEQRLTAWYTRQQQHMQGAMSDLQRQQEQLQQEILQSLAHYGEKSSQEAAQALNEYSRRIDTVVAQAFEEQLQELKQLLEQRPVGAAQEHADNYVPVTEMPDFATLEVQTEIPWDELVDLMDSRLDERFSPLKADLMTALKNVEQHLTEQVNQLQGTLVHNLLGPLPAQYREHQPEHSQNDMQEVFRSIAQLEHLVEAMQVAMASNNTLLTSRLYRHQQLPAEQAHSLHHMTEPLATQEMMTVEEEKE